MTKRPQTVTINVHNLNVKVIQRHKETGVLAVTVGNEGQYHGDVTLFFTDTDNYNRFVSDVNEFLVTEKRQAKNISGDRYCPECAYIGVDRDDVTEHVFGNHPEAVAR